MEDIFTDDFEDHFCASDNDSGLSPRAIIDCGYDTQEMTEELYERIYYENDTESRDDNPRFSVSVVSHKCFSSRSIDIDNKDISLNDENDGGNYKQKNESVKKKRRQDYEMEQLYEEKLENKNSLNVDSRDEQSIKIIQKNPSKNNVKLSYREIIEAAGLTVTDLKNFINEGTNDRCISVDHSSDSESSEYVILSETEMSDECDSTFHSDDEDVETSLTSNILSDSLLVQILNDLPADSSWDISDSDVIGRPKVSSRFYNSLMRVRCHNCGNRGHQRKDCHEPKKNPKCILCGKDGHVFRFCPDQICFRCDQPGHTMRECDEKVAGRRIQCARCHARGHFEERCPDAWRQYHLTVTAGEIIKKNLNDRKEGGKNVRLHTCYNCGEDGHLGHKCDKSRMDVHQIVNSPFVFKYDPIKSVSGTESNKPRKNEHNRSFNRSRNHCLSMSEPTLGLSHSFKDNHHQHMSYDYDEVTDFSLNSFDYLIPKHKSTPNSNKTSRDGFFIGNNISSRMLQAPYTGATRLKKDKILPLMNVSLDPDLFLKRLDDDKKLDSLCEFKVPQVPKKMKKERSMERSRSLKNMPMPDFFADGCPRFQNDFQSRKLESFENFAIKKSRLMDDGEAREDKMSCRSTKREEFWRKRKFFEEEKSRRQMLRLNKKEKFMEKVLKDYNAGKVENGQSIEAYYQERVFEKKKLLKARRRAKKIKLKTTDNRENSLKKLSVSNSEEKSHGFDAYSDDSKINKKTRRRANERRRRSNAFKVYQNTRSRGSNNITLYENWDNSFGPSDPRTVDFSYENFSVTFS